MADEPAKDNGDYLGFGVYAETLWNRIQAALDRDLGSDQALGDDPLVVGIFGEWGAGKSTLLKLTLDRASDYAAQRARHRSGAESGFGDTGFGLTIPVLFQPWKYEHEPHLLVPLLLHIIQALRDSMPKAQTLSEKAAQVADSVWSSSIEALPALVDNFEAVYKATVADLAVADPVTTVGVSVGFKTAGWLAKLLKRPDDADWLRDFKFSTEGRFYYNLQNVLHALTRPGKRIEAVGKLKLSPNARINFVIFVDDLDRCLPEKAVETLELIKTVFNLESFAFVLALDDEVVERGIGHRYKDYALVNKKPEMPITGFEYLEKIVHLPLRLPPLTSAQATAFLPRYESSVLRDRASRLPEAERADWLTRRTWFAPRVVRVETSAPNDTRQLFHLGQLVVASFDACSPRKLVRVVELWHQVLDVLEARERAGLASNVRIAGDVDPRLLMTTVLLQLFQPELFRSLRRSRVGLNVLLDGFTASSENTSPLSASMSDVDLLHWAVYRSSEKPPVDWQEALHCLPNLDAGQRGAAQRLRLPLVERLLEHRSVQRHSFDPLKLFAKVHQSGAITGGVPLPADTYPYFSVLGSVRLQSGSAAGDDPPLLTQELVEVPSSAVDVEGSLASIQLVPTEAAASSTQELSAEKTPTLPTNNAYRLITDPTAVFQSLISPEEAEQRQVAEIAGLGPDAPWLHPDSSKVLRGMVERDFLRASIKGNNDNFVAERRGRLLRGLVYLAKHIPLEERAAWWALVEDAPHQPAPFGNLEQIHAQERWMDVRSAMGIDSDPVKGRFDVQRFHLPKARLLSVNSSEAEREPIPGFVRVFADKEQLFEPFEGESVTLKPYYMARYLTTVDQYAQFVAARGYGDPNGQKPDWWDTMGWAWRTGQWDSQVKDKSYREHLAGRKPELRGAPMLWAEQLAYGSRPATQLNWFEARAYARWLTVQLKYELARLPEGYAVRLPNEAQWERAARAKDLNSADERKYPWGGADEKTAHLSANIRASDIDRPSPVGLFAPNPLGLCDLSGNLWEWQSNLYLPDGSGQDKGRSSDVVDLKTGDEPDKSDLPALRGGAWDYPAVSARASIRAWNPPDFWANDVGFRVVLSLAE